MSLKTDRGESRAASRQLLKVCMYTLCDDAIVHAKHRTVAHVSPDHLVFPRAVSFLLISIFLGTLPVMLPKTFQSLKRLVITVLLTSIWIQL